MDKIVTKVNTPFFEVVEGSNYEVIMTYDTQEVIEFEQFKRLVDAIFKGEGSFVTVNKVVVQKKDIRMIKPTIQKTMRQQNDRDNFRKERSVSEETKSSLEELKHLFDVGFYNAKYGPDWVWDLLPSQKNVGKHPLTAQDRKDCWDAFEKSHPEEARGIIKLTDFV